MNIRRISTVIAATVFFHLCFPGTSGSFYAPSALAGRATTYPTKRMSKYYPEVKNKSIEELKNLLLESCEAVKKEQILWTMRCRLTYYDKKKEKGSVNSFDKLKKEIEDLARFFKTERDEVLGKLDTTGLTAVQARQDFKSLEWRYREMTEIYHLMLEPPETFEEILIDDYRAHTLKQHATYWVHVIRDAIRGICTMARRSGSYDKILPLLEVLRKVEKEWFSPGWVPEPQTVSREVYYNLYVHMDYYRQDLSSWISGLEVLHLRSVKKLSDRQIITLFVNEARENGKLSPGRKRGLLAILYSPEKSEEFFRYFIELLNDFRDAEAELLEDIMKEVRNRPFKYGSLGIAKDPHTGIFMLKKRDE